jgi:hypothetical protein
MWQICPRCKGNGWYRKKPCDLCHDSKVIDDITGLPPSNLHKERLLDRIRYGEILDLEKLQHLIGLQTD